MAKRKPIRVNPEDLRLPVGGVDTHAHLSFPEYAPGSAEPGMELSQVLQRAAASGLAAIGNIFASAEHWEETKNIFRNGFGGSNGTDRPLKSLQSISHLNRSDYEEIGKTGEVGKPQIFFQLGIHPVEANLFTAGQGDAICAAVKSDGRIRAIGEIGLDYYWPDQPPELQKTAFVSQLRMAKKLDLPVSIHCRNAWDDTIALLDEEKFRGYPLLWHCFGGDAGMAEAILERGWHISIPGPVTFKKNEALQEAVALIPPERLHLETDSPYLAPEPWRGVQNEPALLVFTAQTAALCKGMPVNELWLTAGENSKLFFNL